MKRWADHHREAAINIYTHLWYAARSRLHILVLLLDEYLCVSRATRARGGRRTWGRSGWFICDTVARLNCLLGVNLHSTWGFSRPCERTRTACHPDHELYCTFTEHDLRQTPYSYEEMLTFVVHVAIICLLWVTVNTSSTATGTLWIHFQISKLKIEFLINDFKTVTFPEFGPSGSNWFCKINVWLEIYHFYYDVWNTETKI